MTGVWQVTVWTREVRVFRVFFSLPEAATYASRYPGAVGWEIKGGLRAT